MKNLIVAREKEKAELERLMNEPTAQILAVYGRRRTGKTFLIREYFDDSFAFKHTAVSPMELKERGEGELIYRADRVMNLCEMKFTQSDYVISKEYDERLRNKITALQEMTHGKRNVQVALVTTYGLKQNMYSGRVQRVVVIEDLFR